MSALAVGLGLGALLLGPVAQAQNWSAELLYENDTRYRGEDATEKTVGLSKLRNTLQARFSGNVGDWGVRAVLRGSWDGAYTLNDDQYGNKAGGGIFLNSEGGPPPLPHGGGAVNKAVVDGLGLTDNVFGFNATDPNAPRYNPNEGMRVLGDRWHSVGEGVAFGVPVRPCDVDSRGCRDFGEYGNLKRSELIFAEFNDRLDFLREFYVTRSIPLGDGFQELFFKIGRQQVVWGRTDLFRVLDVINPVDFSRNNIYDELEDIRIPMWIATAEWRLGATSKLQDANLQLVWNFDKFRPSTLGQCGSPNVILDAGCLFRGLSNLWDNGGTVSNFANVGPGVLLSTDFGPGQIGIRDVELPNWKIENTQIGVKFEGVTSGGVGFSLNALHYRSQLPSLRGGRAATNAFTGQACDDGNDRCPYLIAFDVAYPRVALIGGSADLEWTAAKAAVRVEAALTDGEEFPNTLDPELYSEKNVFRSVIGIDRPTFIPFISSTRTTLISAQLFLQHIFDHESEQREFGKVGMPDWETNVTGTLLIRAFLKNDRLFPQLLSAYDFRGQAFVTQPSIEWLVSDKLRVIAGANLKTSGNLNRYEFDDCRACNPWPPFTAPDGDGDPFTPGSRGFSGLEPLGRFRAGPIGAARKENELFLTVRYAFNTVSF